MDKRSQKIYILSFFFTPETSVGMIEVLDGEGE